MDVAIEPSLTLEKFEALLRKNTAEINAFLQEVEIGVKIDGTEATTTCHFIKLNGNQQVRFADFIEFLAYKIVDFAIPRTEIEAAQQFILTNNSTSKMLALRKKASSLFTSLKKSGEGGEVLLYLLIEEILKVPQLLCKMNLKTSSEMHVHGCDGIHAKYDEGKGLLSLYWGESKLYQDLGAGIGACFESVKAFLLHTEGDTSAQQRDLQLVRSNIDIGDEKFQNALLTYLDKDHENYNKVIYKAVCLVGFDYNAYPTTPNSGISTDILKANITAEMANWRDKVKTEIQSIPNLSTFELHVFLLPFPSVQGFRDAFFKELGITRIE